MRQYIIIQSQLRDGAVLTITGWFVGITLWLSVTGTIRSQSIIITSLVACPRVSTAIERTSTERDEVTAERAAFEKFIKRVASLDSSKSLAESSPESLSARGGFNRTAVAGCPLGEKSAQNSDSKPTALVRTAYQETVMSVPHYQDAYDESFAQNFTVEFGQSLATSLEEADVLTPPLQSAVLRQARQARDERTKLLNRVETEQKALIDKRRQLRELRKTTTNIERDISCPISELVQSWKQLEEMTKVCNALLKERQTNIQPDGNPGSARSLQQYLYQQFQWCYPVLNDGIEMATKLENVKKEVVRAVYTM